MGRLLELVLRILISEGNSLREGARTSCPRPFSFLGNQSNRLSQGRAKQTHSSTGSTIMTTAAAQRFAQIFGAACLLVGIEISSRLHRYLPKPHPVRVSLGVPLHRVRALLIRRQLTPQHNPRRDRDCGTQRLLKSHRGERVHSRARGGPPGAFHTTRPLLIASGVFFASRRSPDSARAGSSGRPVIRRSVR